jgi:hypothetical protein
LLSRYELQAQIRAAVSGYLLLAVSAVFLLHVAYQAIRLQVFDEVVAAVIGALAVNCVLAIGLIAAVARPAGAGEFVTSSASTRGQVAAISNSSGIQTHSALVASKDGINV